MAFLPTSIPGSLSFQYLKSTTEDWTSSDVHVSNWGIFHINNVIKCIYILYCYYLQQQSLKATQFIPDIVQLQKLIQEIITQKYDESTKDVIEDMRFTQFAEENPNGEIFHKSIITTIHAKSLSNSRQREILQAILQSTTSMDNVST